MHPELFLGRAFVIDANCIDSRRASPDIELLKLWRDEGRIFLNMTSVSQDEASAGKSMARRRESFRFLAYRVEDDSAAVRSKRKAIEVVLFPSGVRSPNEQNDVEICLACAYYGATLITRDGGSKRQPGGILGNRTRLSALGVNAMTPAEAVTHIRALIAKHEEYLAWRRALPEI